MSSPPRSTASAAAPRGAPSRPSASPLGPREAREQLPARLVAVRRLAPAEQLKLAPPTQHERVLVDVAADGRGGGGRADPTRNTGPRRRARPAGLLRELPHARRQLSL